MKKKLPNVLLTTALLLGLGTQAVALNIMDSTSVPAADSSAVLVEKANVVSQPNIMANGVSIVDAAMPVPVEGNTYVSIRTMVETILPGAQVEWDGKMLVASGDNFNMSACPGDDYIIVNGRYYDVTNGVIFENNATMAPVRVVGGALGAAVEWNPENGDITVQTVRAPLPVPEPVVPVQEATPTATPISYSQDDLYWLSRIINAESGNQPLKGKIAVGTVILNRVESSKFPNTIKEVVFQRYNGTYQFSPVSNGSIYKEPNAESVKAAQMCLEGSREAGNSLFFNVAGMKSWAASNKAYVTTIADHAFYM